MIAKDSKNLRESCRSQSGGSRLRSLTLCALALPLASSCSDPNLPSSLAAEEQALHGRPDRLRDYIARQVGGLDKLMVPPDDASIPVPPDDPARPGPIQQLP